MISSSQASELHVHVMNWITSPMPTADWLSTSARAPAQSKACNPSTLSAAGRRSATPPIRQFCNQYHAAQPGFWKRVYYWNTPSRLRHGSRLQGLHDWVRRGPTSRGEMLCLPKTELDEGR